MKHNRRILELRKLILIILILISGLSLNECRDSEDIKMNTIVFENQFDDSDEIKELDALIKKFKDDYGINVVLSYYDSKEEPEKLFSLLRSQNPPDVIEFNSKLLAKAIDESALTILDTADYDLKNFYINGLEVCTVNGKFYCLPWLINVYALFVNPDILKENGIHNYSINTVNELIDNCERIEEEGKYYGCGAVASDWNNLFKVLLPFFWFYGGDLTGTNGTVSINSSNNIKALYSYVMLARTGLADTQRELESQFLNGKSAYCFAPLSFGFRINSEKPAINYLITGFPQDNNKGFIYSDINCLAINSHSKKYQICKKFVNYLVQWKKTKAYVESFINQGLPAVKVPDFSNSPLLKFYNEQINKARTFSYHPYFYNIEKMTATDVDKVVYAEISPEEALNDAQQKVLNFMKTLKKK